MGHQVSVLVEPESGLADYLCRFQVPVIEGLSNSIQLQARSDELRVDVIVIDSYRWLEADFMAVRRRGCRVVTFDDEARRRLPVDAVINGALAGPHLAYRTLPHTRLWLGLPYQVIREEFCEMQIRPLAGTVRRLIVLVGGDDPLGLMPQLAPRLNTIAGGMQPPLQVEMICGPYSLLPFTDELSHVKVTRHPLNLHERMQDADLALSASGQTLYELACCGTPTIAFCSSGDQAHNLAALAEAGVVWDTGQANKPNWLDAVEEAIRTLAADFDRRQEMSKVAQRLIDGRGADRLVDELQQLVASTVSQQ